MRTGGMMVRCDRCGAEQFIALLEETPKEADGGYTRWMDRRFEKLPEGWTRDKLYGPGHEYIDLCPTCTGELRAAQERFVGGGA